MAKVSGRRVLLILDAWEKSPSMRSEFSTLEAFLKHQDDWPDTHVFLGIRSPDVQTAGASDEAFRNAGMLQRLSPSALRYDLSPIDLSTSRECERIIGYLHAQVPATRPLPAAELLKMIDGFPGVVSRWVSNVNRDAMRTVDDLQREALTAQTLRYLEFDQLLNGLPDAHRIFASRLAFLPRLDADRWPTFRQALLGDASETIIGDLIDRHVLENDRYPTYGHDTRHAAARNWFSERQINLTRRVAEGLIEKVASQVSGGDESSVLLVGALAASATFLMQLALSPTAHCLVNAACSAFEETAAVFDPAFDDALAIAGKQDPSFVPLIAICLVARGATRALRGESEGGIADFTKVIAYENAPAEQRAQAYVNRGITRSQGGDRCGAIADYTAAIELPHAPADQISAAFNNRGVAKDALGDDQGAMADYKAAIEWRGAPADRVAQALYNRGIKKTQRGDADGALLDFTAVIELPNALAEQVAQAFYNRGVVKGQGGDDAGAIEDYTKVIASGKGSPEEMAQAIFNRAVMRSWQGDGDGAFADFTAVIELPDAPPLQVAKALTNRGLLRGRHGDIDGSIDDQTKMVAMPDAPPGWVARGYNNRAIARSEGADIEGAIADCTAALALCRGRSVARAL